MWLEDYVDQMLPAEVLSRFAKLNICTACLTLAERSAIEHLEMAYKTAANVCGMATLIKRQTFLILGGGNS